MLHTPADPSGGFFCQEDAKCQPLLTSSVMAKKVCEQDPVSPISSRLTLFTPQCKGLFSAAYHFIPLCWCNIHEYGRAAFSSYSGAQMLHSLGLHGDCKNTEEKDEGKIRGDGRRAKGMTQVRREAGIQKRK